MSMKRKYQLFVVGRGKLASLVHIFYASDTRPNAAIQSSIWRRNLYETLVSMGHHVTELQGDLGETFRNLDPAIPAQKAFIEKNRPVLSALVWKQVQEAHARQPLDLFFSYFYDACITPEIVEAINGLGVPTVNWYCNGSFQLHLVRAISPHYRYCLVPEKFRLKDYEAMGAHPIYCQEAANPDFYKPYDVPREFDVAFVGQAYGERPQAVADLIEAGIDVRVWGPGWTDLTKQGQRDRQTIRMRLGKLKRMVLGQPLPGVVTLPAHNVGGVLSDDEMVKTFSRAKINLGFSSCGDTHRGEERIVQVRLRDFEVPMSGGFYLVEHMDELGEFFELGREIETYRDFSELRDKVRFYLQHDDARETIRRAGFARARRDHTWQKRFEMAFERIGLEAG